uniref:Uncharacterized protein n=1 Tax=Janibacter limosus TaxID=53458 RepID=A0AC61U7L6_9MICO|nr:hypothetical protein [Janibacter limosus]
MPRAIARSALAPAASGRRVGVLVTVALAMLLAVLVPWQQLASAGGADEGEAAPVSTARELSEPAATGQSASSAGDVLHERSAPRRSPRRLAQELTSLRQQVVVDWTVTRSLVWTCPDRRRRHVTGSWSTGCGGAVSVSQGSR